MGLHTKAIPSIINVKISLIFIILNIMKMSISYLIKKLEKINLGFKRVVFYCFETASTNDIVYL